MLKNLTRKPFLVIISLIVIILAVAAILVLARTGNPETAIPSTPGTPILTATSEPATMTPQTDTQAILDTLYALIKKAQALQKPGWLHIVKTNSGDNDPGNHGEINGVVLPLDFTQEIWQFIDEGGNVPESVSIERGMDGQIVQAAVRKDGYVWSTLTGEYTMETPEASTSQYQPYITSILHDVQHTGEYHRLELVEIKLESRDAFRLTIFYENSQPVKTVDFNQSVIKAEKTLFIDTLTGLPIREEMIFTLEDGSRRVLYRVDYTTHEYVDQPSIEVISYLTALAELPGKIRDYSSLLTPTPTELEYPEEIYRPPLPLQFGAWPATTGCPNPEGLQESELDSIIVTTSARELLFTGVILREKSVSDPALWPLLPFANRTDSSGQGFDETWIDSIRKANETAYAQLVHNQCGEELARFTWVAKICPGPCAQNASESLKDDLFFINRAGMWLIWAVY